MESTGPVSEQNNKDVPMVTFRLGDESHPVSPDDEVS